ncbi:MAG TPA: hypothetical protein VIG96_03090 [Blastococcus sp.]
MEEQRIGDQLPALGHDPAVRGRAGAQERVLSGDRRTVPIVDGRQRRARGACAGVPGTGCR